MTDETNFPDVDGPEHDRFRALAQQVTAADTQLVDPPADIWQGIEGQLQGVEADAEPAAVVSLASRRRRMIAGIGGAVAAAAAVLGFVIVASGDDSDTEFLAGTELVNTDLPVPFTGMASVDLVTIDGQFALEIDLDAVPDAGEGFLELWVIDTDVVGMHSLGVVEESGLFKLPPSVDPEGFPVVDISVEMADGVATHSGQSVLRGVLDL